MSQLEQIQGRITANEYLALYPEETNQPVELIDGEVIMSPPPLDIHQYISIRLSLLIGNHVFERNLGQVRTAPSDLHLDENNVPQPDLFYVAKDNTRCKINGKGWWQGAPDLVIEIISPSSIRQDRITKFNLYAKHHVPEYWIVEPEGRFIEINILEGDSYRRMGVYAEEDQFTSTVLPELTIDVNEVFPKPE